MKNVVVWSVLFACACTVSAFAQNKVIFDNQSGDPALVKLIGPTQTEVEVPTGAKVGADAAAGQYVIKVRYGTPGNYRYSRGEAFDVKETATARSETTITLHKVVAGNYDTKGISATEFGESSATSLPTVHPTKSSKCIVAGPWEIVVVSVSTTNVFQITYNAQMKTTLTPAPDEVIAVVKIRGKRLREEYTSDEETQIRTWSLAPLLDAGRKLMGKTPFLSTGNFMLCYVQPSAGDGRQKIVASLCRALICDSGLLPMHSLAGDTIGMSTTNTVEATLAFPYYPKDQIPLILFWPVPHGKESGGARLQVQGAGRFSVDYCGMESLREYVQEALK